MTLALHAATVCLCRWVAHFIVTTIMQPTKLNINHIYMYDKHYQSLTDKYTAFTFNYSANSLGEVLSYPRRSSTIFREILYIYLKNAQH